MPTIDVHQHLWPQPLIDVLAARTAPPRLRGSTLELQGEGDCAVDLGAHDVDTRIALLDRNEIDVAVISFAPTFGCSELPGEGRPRADGRVRERDPRAVASSNGRLLALAADGVRDGFVGTCVAASELAELDTLAPTLDALATRGAFLFVHPGAAHPPAGAPDWWAAVVDYTAQMQAAYASWLAAGAARWPELKVVFAMLAGGGPFQFERLVSRGPSGRELLHDNVFFETSSYGRRAIELCLSTFGVESVVFGSDAPVIEPATTLDSVRGFGDAVATALCDVNPMRLFP